MKALGWVAIIVLGLMLASKTEKAPANIGRFSAGQRVRYRPTGGLATIDGKRLLPSGWVYDLVWDDHTLGHTMSMPEQFLEGA